MLLWGIFNLLALVGLSYWALRLRRGQAALAETARSLAVAPTAMPPGLRQELAQGHSLIGIRILNPMELAAQKSAFAKNFGSLASGVIRRRVDDTVAGILREQLAEQGVQAQVQVYRD